jgi:hypothetical protein
MGRHLAALVAPRPAGTSPGSRRWLRSRPRQSGPDVGPSDRSPRQSRQASPTGHRRRAIRINSRTGRLPGVGAVARLLGSVDDAGQAWRMRSAAWSGSGWRLPDRRWGVEPVLAGWTYAGDLLVWGALAVSFPVAILTRSPGCELGALPWLFGGREGEAAPRPGCAVGLNRLGAWETARRRGRAAAKPRPLASMRPEVARLRVRPRRCSGVACSKRWSRPML